MSKQVHFHIDSEKAYNVTKAAEFGATVGTGKLFEDYMTKKNVWLNLIKIRAENKQIKTIIPI